MFDNQKFWMNVAQSVIDKAANGKRVIKFENHELHVNVYYIQKTSPYGCGKLRYDFYIPNMFLFRFWVLDISHYPSSSEQFREGINVYSTNTVYKVKPRYQRKRIKIYAKYSFEDIEDMLMMLRLHYE